VTKEAHLRQDWWSKGEWTDTFVYAVLAAEGKPRWAANLPGRAQVRSSYVS